jgi:hypothetical protein
MKNPIRIFLLLLAISSGTISLKAQLSDLHYLPPLKQRDGAFVQQIINISTPETTPFTVYVYKGTNTTPVASLTVSNSAGATYNPGNGDNDVTLLTDAKTGIVQSNAGLRFESTSGHKFYVNWRGHSASQGSSLTTKGRNALGTAFKWVGAPNRGIYYTALSSSLGIMATEDNTVVNIFGYNPSCTFRLGSNAAGITDDAISITLNKGQSYVLEAPLTADGPNRDGWLGASITSNNPIAVSFGELHYQPRSNVSSRDAAMDQIIPENTVGKDYIFVRGNGIDDLEFPVIIATQNDTKIYVNGGTAPIATINSGEYYQIPATYYSQSSTSGSVPGANMYVHTSKEAYAVQSVAGSSNDATADINFIAPVNCLLANQVDNIPDVSNVAGQSITGGITIIAAATINDADIVVKYGNNTVSTTTLTNAKHTVAGTSDWKTYYLSGLTGNVSVTANGPIAVGYFGASGVIGVSGYFSGFETIPTIEVQKVGDGCLPSTVLKATAGFTAYTWYHDGAVVPGITGNSYTPEEPGKYTVTVTNGTCAYTSANQLIYDCHPEIVVSTTADKNGIISGETVTFKVTVGYMGDLNVNDLVLTNLVPGNVTVTGTSATYGSVTHSGSTYTWNIGTMRNGEEHILLITATGNTVTVPATDSLTVTKTQTIVGTESNKIADDFSETLTVYSALASEPTSRPSGLYFTNTGSAHPYNNVLHFTASADADGYIVVRKAGSEPGFVPEDGTSYSTGIVAGDEIINVGSETTVTDYAASASTDYHYVIYPYKGGGAATNYLTSNPVKAVINNRATNNFSMAISSKSSSAGLADQGVNVTFVNGVASGGTTITATKYASVLPENYTYGLPAGYNSVKGLYYHVSSSNATPGDYVISLDFSALGMSADEWNAAHVLKRSNASSAWLDITDKVITRKADGLLGKLVIEGLSSFSDFAIGANETPLPLTLLDFSAKAEGTGVVLEWKTANEQGTKDFVIQHSSNSNTWKEIGTIAASGNSTAVLSYRFMHTSPVQGTNYYRLLQRDIDGKFSLSSISQVQFGGYVDRIVILGNPVITKQLKFLLPKSATVNMYSSNGKLVYQGKMTAGLNSIDVGNLPKGMYSLQANDNTEHVIIK